MVRSRSAQRRAVRRAEAAAGECGEWDDEAAADAQDAQAEEAELLHNVSLHSAHGSLHVFQVSDVHTCRGLSGVQSLHMSAQMCVSMSIHGAVGVTVGICICHGCRDQWLAHRDWLSGMEHWLLHADCAQPSAMHMQLSKRCVLASASTPNANSALLSIVNVLTPDHIKHDFVHKPTPPTTQNTGGGAAGCPVEDSRLSLPACPRTPGVACTR